jgi:hypothetical protein
MRLVLEEPELPDTLPPRSPEVEPMLPEPDWPMLPEPPWLTFEPPCRELEPLCPELDPPWLERSHPMLLLDPVPDPRVPDSMSPELVPRPEPPELPEPDELPELEEPEPMLLELWFRLRFISSMVLSLRCPELLLPGFLLSAIDTSE